MSEKIGSDNSIVDNNFAKSFTLVFRKAAANLGISQTNIVLYKPSPFGKILAVAPSPKLTLQLNAIGICSVAKLVCLLYIFLKKVISGCSFSH